MPDWLITSFCSLVASGVGAYFASYLKAKGENLATKEDITDITQKIEEVKNTYAQNLEDFKHRKKMQFVALEKRLEVHQEAYVWWLKLLRSATSGGAPLREAQKWWEENSLYLTPEVREGFQTVLSRVFEHPHLLSLVRSKPVSTSAGEDVTNNYNAIKELGSMIVKAVELPNLDEVALVLEEK